MLDEFLNITVNGWPESSTQGSAEEIDLAIIQLSIGQDRMLNFKSDKDTLGALNASSRVLAAHSCPLTRCFYCDEKPVTHFSAVSALQKSSASSRPFIAITPELAFGSRQLFGNLNKFKQFDDPNSTSNASFVVPTDSLARQVSTLFWHEYEIDRYYSRKSKRRNNGAKKNLRPFGVFGGFGHTRGDALAFSIAMTAYVLWNERRRAEQHKMPPETQDFVPDNTQDIVEVNLGFIQAVEKLRYDDFHNDNLYDLEKDACDKKNRKAWINVLETALKQTLLRQEGISKKTFHEQIESIVKLALHPISLKVGMDNVNYSSRGADDEYFQEQRSEMHFNGQTFSIEERYNLGICFVTDRDKKPKKSEQTSNNGKPEKFDGNRVRFTVYCKNRPEQRSERQTIGTIGQPDVNIALQCGRYTLLPAICFDFLDTSQDSYQKKCMRLLEGGHFMASQHLLFLVSCLQASAPSHPVWWTRIREFCENMDQRPATLILAHKASWNEVDGFHANYRWQEDADTYRNLSGVYCNTFRSVIKTASSYIPAQIHLNHGRHTIRGAVSATNIRHFEPVIVSGRLTMRAVGSGVQALWDADHLDILDEENNDCTSLETSWADEVLIQTRAWNAVELPTKGSALQEVMDTVRDDLKEEKSALNSQNPLHEDFLQSLLWGGPKGDDGGRGKGYSGWMTSFNPLLVQLDNVEDIYPVWKEWCRTVVMHTFVKEVANLKYIRLPIDCNQLMALSSKNGILSSLTVIWTPPKHLDPHDTLGIAEAVRSLASSLPSYFRRLNIVIADHASVDFDAEEFLELVAEEKSLPVKSTRLAHSRREAFKLLPPKVVTLRRFSKPRSRHHLLVRTSRVLGKSLSDKYFKHSNEYQYRMELKIITASKINGHLTHSRGKDSVKKKLSLL